MTRAHTRINHKYMKFNAFFAFLKSVSLYLCEK